MKWKESLRVLPFIMVFVASCLPVVAGEVVGGKEPVDYVDPRIGNISHMLEPTYATVSLPNSMLRMVPCRREVTDNLIYGLPVSITGHRGGQTFVINPFSGDVESSPGSPEGRKGHSYDLETITPYLYSCYLPDMEAHVLCAPSHRSAVYSIRFDLPGPNGITVYSTTGDLEVSGNSVTGWYGLYDKKTRLYIFLETAQTPEWSGPEGDGAGSVRL